MKSFAINGSARASIGKTNSKELRLAGLVPCVLYGGEKQLHFSLSSVDLDKVIYTPSVYIIELNIEGATYRAIVKDIQFHPVTDNTLHVDFLELIEDKKVMVNIPFKTNGVPLGVRNGGKLRINKRALTISAFPKDLPDSIELNIETMRIGHSVRIKDIEGDFEFLHPENQIVVAVNMARGAAEEVEEEDGAEAPADDAAE
ncbi:MAG: large subunit ribosomal protein L25 [Flavobacteriales bacterium]|jgi:large subunit ribosomal protein L25